MWNRVYADFLMPSRLDSYRRLLDSALRAGYMITSIERFWRLIVEGAVDPAMKYLILRHDIDTGPQTAAEMWKIERAFEIESSYFFRLSTLDIGLMRAISDAGGHASYHYEELATVAKRRHPRNPEEVVRLIPEAQDDFRRNLEKLRAMSGLPMRVVASHGDFVNRRLGIANWVILDDPHFRHHVGVELETYDETFMHVVSSRHADAQRPTYWIPDDPGGAIQRGESVVYLLIHPREWRAERSTNARADMMRLWQGLLYVLPVGSGRGTTPRATAAHPPAGLRVAMALYGDLTYDSRVQREAEALSRAGHAVTIYCLLGSVPPGAPYRVVKRLPSRSSVLPDGSSPFLRAGPSSRLARLRRRFGWLLGYARNLRAWGRWAIEAAGEVDVWHAHDLTGLIALGPLARGPVRLVYDSHEISLETGTAERLPALFRRLLSMYERLLTRRAVALVTVNESYAGVLQRHLRPRRTVIVRNCPPRWTPPTPLPSRLRDAAAVPDSQPMIVYHGAFDRHRGIEQLAEAMLSPGLESAHLALLGFGGMRPELEHLAGDPRFAGRLHVLDAVPPSQLLEWLAGADVDVIPLQGTTLNLRLCTPNKLWESLAAGVPVVVSDFPTMRRIVLEDPVGHLGAVCDPADPTSIASAIRAIIELPADARAELRARCLRAAFARWNWETESSKLVALYAELRSA